MPTTFKRQSLPLEDRPWKGDAIVSSGRNFFVYSLRFLNFKLWLTLAWSRASLTIISPLNLLYPWNLWTPPVEAAGLAGQHLSRITHRTRPILLITSGNQLEHIQFVITKTSQTPIILGFPWLRLHNPQLDWGQQRIAYWSYFCLAHTSTFQLFGGCRSN